MIPLIEEKETRFSDLSICIGSIPQYSLVECHALMEIDSTLCKSFGPANVTPVISAAIRGHAEVVYYLLAHDLSCVELSKSNGKNALHFSARQGHVEIVKALLEKDQQLPRRTDKKGQTALHMAVKGTNTEVVKALVDADPATVMLPDRSGNTALHVATRKKRSEVFESSTGCVLILGADFASFPDGRPTARWPHPSCRAARRDASTHAFVEDHPTSSLSPSSPRAHDLHSRLSSALVLWDDIQHSVHHLHCTGPTTSKPSRLHGLLTERQTTTTPSIMRPSSLLLGTTRHFRRLSDVTLASVRSITIFNRKGFN
ncbi:hypothetical protein KSP40_PGU007731 [Platanthera guangdongensis]|uniref:Uncharacterized protein n=1 Tax=Platanthera guangdongensis TaxID=2320717 RepID=A0ABR2ME03_9ASPA